MLTTKFPSNILQLPIILQDHFVYALNQWDTRLQCTWKTFKIHQTFVWWAFNILFKFVKSLIRHLGLAIRNVWCVRWFSWTLRLQCSVISHWLGACTKWSLLFWWDDIIQNCQQYLKKSYGPADVNNCTSYFGAGLSWNQITIDKKIYKSTPNIALLGEA